MKMRNKYEFRHNKYVCHTKYIILRSNYFLNDIQ